MERAEEQARSMIRIGIDVGGANTDAAIMEDDRVVLSFKATTSTDVTTGVIEALTGTISSKRLRSASGCLPCRGAATARMGPPNPNEMLLNLLARTISTPFHQSTRSEGRAETASARAHAAPTRAASPPRHPISERPTGIPEALPAGMLT
jgi:Hydantoinase/oxoprolinase N-terminal region